jgi:site-specific DNA-methyltransferase (adenine-specific)
MAKWSDDYMNCILLGDCLDVMREMPDKCVDLVLTDPPYGIGDKLAIGGCTKRNLMQELYNESKWVDVAPSQEYFNELFRISKHQIICGGNYFDLPPTRGFIVWDKVKFATNYSQVEYIWTSFDAIATIFRFCSNGGFVVKPEEKHVHPTQKPTPLFEWILNKYSKPDDIILDPFLGSGTTIAACINTGRSNWIGIEKEADYCALAEQRIARATQQLRMFT